MSRNQNVHTPDEIVRIRRAAAVTAQVRDQIAALIRPGMTTMDVDIAAGELIRASGGKSAFLNYHGYPGNICISVNEEVVHGIGSPRRVIGGHDIVSIDVGVEFDGAVGDTAVTVSMDQTPSADVRRLLEGTRKALDRGIAAARCGKRVGDISRAVELAARESKLGIVREYVGHGSGIELHEAPEVPNYSGWGGGPVLVPGMVLCIEPMLNLGGERIVVDKKDGWTVRTRDGAWSAHFEHMILITDNEPEILTWQKTM